MEESLIHCYHEMIPVASFTDSPLLFKEEQQFTNDTYVENLEEETYVVKANRI